MYQIKIYYSTGNSFGSEDTSDVLAPIWENKKLAQKALQSLKEHYTLYHEKEAYSFRASRSDEEIFEEVRTKDWYGNFGHNDRFYKEKNGWHFFLGVELDDGSYINMSPSQWCGYFETLHKAEIVNTDELDSVVF